ncbi:right-handed parallel beta-helix repeat-containing protein [Candidatus Bipolaricaulota bacterium]|nr:right-handed parallel beta-helix repeat-containing protein [Candidatus Bipolaricaulota bacterium]
MPMLRTTYRHVVLVVVILSCSVGILSGCFSVSGPPIAVIVKSPSTCYPLMAIEFDATRSTGGRSDIVEYRWQLGDGNSKMGSNVKHGFSSSGEFIVQLQITTTDGETATTSQVVQVLDALVVPGDYSKIQDAIDAARSGDTIVVLPGTYRENIRIQGKTILLKSSDPTNPDIVKSTILDGVEYGRPTVNFGGGTFATIDGFTILFTLGGGGSQCTACAGAIYAREASPYIRNNRIINSQNSGIALYESAAHIEGNLIANNSSTSPGGGITIDSYGQAPTIIGNTFEGNSAPSGGAIFIITTAVQDPTPGCAAPTVVKDNEFVNNSSTQFGGGAIFVEYTGNLSLDTPDTNTYSGNDPNDIFYVVPQ